MPVTKKDLKQIGASVAVLLAVYATAQLATFLGLETLFTVLFCIVIFSAGLVVTGVVGSVYNYFKTRSGNE
mgnify:CR=1 FL=1